MDLVPMTNLLKEAKRNKYAVGQFNLLNMEVVQAIAETAEEEQSPVIFGVGEMTIRYMGLDYVVANAKAAAARARVPIALHLDHGSSFDIVMKCIRAGFSSVMFDGSHHPYEENVRLTRQVVEAAHAVGISVEGELGTIGGIEEDLDVNDADIRLPGADEAIRFWQETGVDALAVAVGTAHGMYKKEPHIHCDTIREIVSFSDAPFVLHGGSGVPDGMIKEAIEAGVSKINVNTESQVSFTQEVRRILREQEELFDAKTYLGSAKAVMKEVVRSKIRLFGSNGRIGR